MTVFLNTNELGQGYFNPENFFREMKTLHIAAKERIQKCDRFLKSLEESNPAQAQELHLRVAKIWREKSGSLSFEEDCALGKRLSQHHMDDPFVHTTVLDFMEMRETPPGLARASVQWVAENRVDIETPDPFQTKYTLYLPKNPTDEFNRNLAIAAEALSYAARKTPFSGNYNRCPYGAEVIEELRDVATSTTFMQKKCIKKTSNEYLLFIKNTLPNSFERRGAKAKICKKAIVGNCAELATSAFFYGCKEKIGTKINMQSIHEGNHVFFTVGEGDNTVIADPWKRVLFPESQILERLYDYKGCDPLCRPKLEKYDPQKQSLSLAASNVYNVKELRERLGCGIPELEELLDKFHSIPVNNQNQKIAQATAIIKYMKQFLFFRIIEDQGLSNLFSQLHYLTNDQPFDILDLPNFSSLKKAKEANDPKIFYEAVRAGASREIGIIDSGLWLAYRTGNFAFVEEALKLGAQPSTHTFLIAFLIAEKTGNINYLNFATKIGAQAHKQDSSCFFSFAQKTRNLDFINLAIKAGAEPDLFEIQSMVKEALRTGNFDLLALFDLKSEVGTIIKYQLKLQIRKDPISNCFQCFFPFAQKTGNINFLRIAIEAGAEPNKSEIETMVKNAVETKNFNIINLFSLKTDIMMIISDCLNIHASLS